MKLALACCPLLAVACGHARPVEVSFAHTDLGHCGPLASIELVASRACKLTVTQLGQPPHEIALAPADCTELFDAAASARLSEHPSCTAPQPFTAGASITFDSGAKAFACWDAPFTARLAALADRVAPDWRVARAVGDRCDFSDDTIQGELVRPSR